MWKAPHVAPIPNVYQVIHWNIGELRPRLPRPKFSHGGSCKGGGSLMKYLLGAHTKVLVETGLPYLAVTVTVHTELYTGNRDMSLS